MLKTVIKPIAKALAGSSMVLAAYVASPVVLGELGLESSWAKAEAQSMASREAKKQEDAYLAACGLPAQPKLERPRRMPAMSPKLYKKIEEAQQLADPGEDSKDKPDPLAAIQLLNAEIESGDHNGYETAMMLNLRASMFYQASEAVKDQSLADRLVGKAISSWEEMIKQDGLPEINKVPVMYSLASLYAMQDRLDDAENILKQWFALTDKVSPDAFGLLGILQFQKAMDENASAAKRKTEEDKALKSIEAAICLAKQKDSKLKENWFQLLRALYYQKGDKKKVGEVLEEMITHWNKVDYWLQLGQIKGELKQEADQVAAVEVVYMLDGLEKEKKLLMMAGLFFSQEVPYKAASVVDKGMKADQIEKTERNLELLGNAWWQAQEIKKALPEMAKACEASDEGEACARLANLYLDNDQYDKAVNMVDLALKKGSVKRPDSAYVVKGMAQFNQKKYTEAIRAFRSARGAAQDLEDEKQQQASMKLVDQWIKYVQGEKERADKLDDGLLKG